MRWLKTLVIGMGLLIVIGLTVVIVEVARRAGAPSPSSSILSTASGPTPPAPPVIGATAPAGRTPSAALFGDTRIVIPPGATAQDVITDGGRLIVRLRRADGGAALLLIDAATGTRLGLITLENRAKGQ